MKLKPEQAIKRFQGDGLRAALVFGSDLGQVREIAEQIAATAVADLRDPFRVVELSGQTLRDDPARLADEAAAMSFGGGRRLVRLRDPGEGQLVLIQSVLANPAAEALIVLEAGTLEVRSKLRAWFEAEATVAAVACYPDQGADLERVVRQTLASHQVSIAPAAMAELCEHLGADRLATRSEVEKLALAVGPGGEIGLSEIEALLIDGATVALDDIAYAVADGEPEALDRALARARSDGTQPIQAIRAVQRHFQRLHRVVGAIAGGEARDVALRSLRPPIFFSRRGAFAGQVQAWPLARIGVALARLTEAEIHCKSTGTPVDALCAHMLGDLALRTNQARRARRR